MYLDGHLVEVGDTVYDLIPVSTGTVVTVDATRFTVDFGHNRIVPVNYQGVRLSNKPTRLHRTVYWDDPTKYCVPSKDSKVNALYFTINRALSAFFG